MKKSKIAGAITIACLIGVIYITQSAKGIETTPEFNPNDGLSFIVVLGVLAFIFSIISYKQNK